LEEVFALALALKNCPYKMSPWPGYDLGLKHRVFDNKIVITTRRRWHMAQQYVSEIACTKSLSVRITEQDYSVDSG